VVDQLKASTTRRCWSSWSQRSWASNSLWRARAISSS
jgi:hypothetical protein